MTPLEIIPGGAGRRGPAERIARRLRKLMAALRHCRAAWFAPFSAADEEALATYDARAW